MRHVPTLLRRELAAYFLSPMAYLVLLAFQVIAWIDFYVLVRHLSDPRTVASGPVDPMTVYIAGNIVFWVALLVAVPALTMRLLAEERRSGTIEGLLTVPITEAEVVVAKWLGGLVMFWALLLPFAIYLPVLRHYGHYPFDLGPVAALAIGLTTIGMMFVAIGVFFSALTKHQIVAAIGTFGALFVLIVVTNLAYSFAVQNQEPWADGARFVAILPQAAAFATGRLDIRYPALHVSVAVVLMYLTVKVLQTRRG